MGGVYKYSYSRLPPGTSQEIAVGCAVELGEQAQALGPVIPIQVSLGHSVTKLHYPQLKVHLP